MKTLSHLPKLGGCRLFVPDTFLIWQIIVVAAAVTACMPVFAQSAATSPTNRVREFLSQFPPRVKPRPGHGELLLVRSATGASQVVRLHCALDPYAMVMLPTGELKVIARTKVKPTTNPFVAPSLEEIQESLKAAGLSKFKVEKGKYYCYVYDCSDRFLMHARSILETMLPGVVESLKSWGLKVERPEAPMFVVIMPNRAAYDAYKATPKEMTAYYNPMSNHVVMYEDQDLVDAAPEYAAKKAGYVVAHEGVHQLLANSGVQKRLSNWPPWICEGLAEYYCPLKVHSSLVRKANAELPERTMKWTKAGMANDLRMHDLLKMNASGNLIKKLVEADNIDADGYALAWGLVHYLASKKPEEFRAYLADVSKYEPLDEATAPVAGKADRLFVKHFGSDFESLDRELQAYLTSKRMQADYDDPIENQTHYIVKCVQKVGRSFAVQLVITTSPAAAKKWKEEKEAVTKNASFFTIVCKSRDEAERQLALLQSR
jgi:hypothetical protein